MREVNEDSKGNQTSNSSVIDFAEHNNPKIVTTLIDNKSSLTSYNDENSIVAYFLDTFNIKKLLETIAYNQRYIKVTQNFIHIILLLIFLIFIFWEADVLRLEKSSPTITIIILIFVAFFELLGANTSLFKNIFDNDLKTKKFIAKLPLLSNNEIREESQYQNFSPSNLDYFIERLRNVNEYSPEVVYIILDSQYLRKQNLDLLFSPEIIKNVSPKLILRILFKKRNNLTNENILNIYKNCLENQKIVKTLIATQEHSDFLIQLYPENSKLLEYYQKYQERKEHIDWMLRLIPIGKLNKISRDLALLVWFFLMGITTLGLTFELKTNTSKSSSFQDFVVTFFGTLIMVSFFYAFILKPLSIKVYNYYYKHILNNIVK